MISISYIKGDATTPIGKGNKLLIHCCNDIGSWGKGFVLAINQRWPQVEVEYRKWHATNIDAYGSGPFQLGAVQFVPVSEEIVIGNMIGQKGTRGMGNPIPIKYDAIRSCLIKVRNWIIELGENEEPTVHCPRFGSGLAGGDWKEIEKIIQQELCEKNISVLVYDF